jgi:hypothetical protein
MNYELSKCYNNRKLFENPVVLPQFLYYLYLDNRYSLLSHQNSNLLISHFVHFLNLDKHVDALYFLIHCNLKVNTNKRQFIYNSFKFVSTNH